MTFVRLSFHLIGFSQKILSLAKVLIKNYILYSNGLHTQTQKCTCSPNIHLLQRDFTGTSVDIVMELVVAGNM